MEYYWYKKIKGRKTSVNMQAAVAQFLSVYALFSFLIHIENWVHDLLKGTGLHLFSLIAFSSNFDTEGQS